VKGQNVNHCKDRSPLRKQLSAVNTFCFENKNVLNENIAQIEERDKWDVKHDSDS
jgi:hypothetical protein